MEQFMEKLKSFMAGIPYDHSIVRKDNDEDEETIKGGYGDPLSERDVCHNEVDGVLHAYGIQDQRRTHRHGGGDTGLSIRDGVQDR